MDNEDDIRVILAIDFGTTFSGFAIANTHKSGEQVIEVNATWPRAGTRETGYKTPTLLQYDSDLNVVEWGYATMARSATRGRGRGRAGRKSDDTQLQMIELFKLLMSPERPDENKGNRRRLPPGLKFQRVITDYLKLLKKEIDYKIETRWPGINYFKNVMPVLSVPAEWGQNTKIIMRQCCFDAGLIDNLETTNLEFTTEPEAAAIYCMEFCDDYKLKTGDTFMVVDCGGGTVDLTTRELLTEKTLGEITESKGACCGGSFVDLAFMQLVAKKLSIPWATMDMILATHSSAMKFFVETAFWPIKHAFTGNEEQYYEIEIDIEDKAPFLIKYVSDESASQMANEDWLIFIDFKEMKALFDGAVDKIVQMVGEQLESASKLESGPKEVNAVFLVGGFSENAYVQTRIKEKYSKPGRVIAVPINPITAIVRGAAMYGLNIETNEKSPYYGLNRTVQSRVLKFTYGTEISSEWKPGDPESRRTPSNRIIRFCCLARRGTQINVVNRFTDTFGPVNPNQNRLPFNLYHTSKYDAEYCDEEGMKLLGKWAVLLNDVHLGLNRPVEFSLSFGTSEIKTTAFNKRTGEMCVTTWEIPE